MKILVYGSINFDIVFSVSHIVMEGETVKSSSMRENLGGKGANQAIALKKAGSDVYFAGHIGSDGEALKKNLEKYEINTDYLTEVTSASGRAIIQLDRKRQNSIIVHPGANNQVTKEEIDEVLSHFEEDDIIVLQNEIPFTDYLIDKAYDRGMQIVLNPSPFEDKIRDWNLDKVDYLIVNEVEAKQILQTTEEDYLKLVQLLRDKYINTEIVMTTGSDGAYYQGIEGTSYASAVKVKVVDTTAAGDTFLGYFITFISEGNSADQGLEDACYAASLCVSKFGASQAIPERKEVKPYSFLPSSSHLE